MGVAVNAGERGGPRYRVTYNSRLAWRLRENLEQRRVRCTFNGKRAENRMASLIRTQNRDTGLARRPVSAQCPHQFWNATTNPGLVRIMQRLTRGEAPRFSIVVGPTGTGKTVVANYL